MNRTRDFDGSPEPRAKARLSLITKIMLAVGAVAALGCLGGQGGPPRTTPVQGITLGTPTENFSSPIQTRGETFTLPVTITKSIAADSGTTVITPTPIAGVTFNPTSISREIPAAGTATVSFQVTIGPSATFGDHPLEVKRTGGGLLDTSTILTIAERLAGGTITPTNATITAGTTKTFQVAILPRGDTEGPMTFTVNLNGPDLTYSPHNFTVNLIRHSTTPILETITVNAPPAAAMRDTQLRIRQESLDICAAAVHIRPAGAGDPTFSITASASEVTTANGTTSEQSVLFTVSSVNGFSGPLKVTWVTDGAINPVPDDNNFMVNVTPSTPATFSRRFRRLATHQVPLPVTFNVTDNPFTTTRSVSVTVNAG